MEFGLIAVPFVVLVLFVVEIGFDLFTQAALDQALYQAARQLQTGNAQNVKNGDDFVARYLCPALGSLLSCSGVSVKVQRIAPGAGQDYYDYTTGSPPISGGALDLSSYNSGSFCNSGPAQMLLVSAVYVGPTAIGRLLPGPLAVSFNGQLVHATLSTVGVVSERYAPTTAANGTAAAC